MAKPVQPLNLSDFTGGLNLRADAFQLKNNESPDMLNVDVDPRGGVRSRKGWERWNATAVSTWHPQRLHVWEQPDGTRMVLAANNGKIVHGAAGTLTNLMNDDTVSTAFDVTTTEPHGVDFAEWGDSIYMASGWDGDVARYDAADTVVTNMSWIGPTYEDDYTTPDLIGLNFPNCKYLCTYQGYMVAANVKEQGSSDGIVHERPNRIRFSHPNNPENWAELDFIDINGGGARITGIVAFSDHVVVFKTNSVWAIYGNEMETFTPVNITHAVGAIHRNAICVSEDAAYFYSHPTGVLKYTPGSGIEEVSQALRPIIDSGDLNTAVLDKMFMGFLNRRLWWSVPYEVGVTATDCRATFVYDPSLKAWTLYTDADGDGLGPFAEGSVEGDGGLLLAAHRVHGYLLKVDENADAVDHIDAADVGFPTLYATRWLHAGWPSLKKAWRRPDYVVTEEESEWTLNVDVMRDYDEGVPRSSHHVLVETGASGFVWGDFVWGDGSLWGGAPKGAHIEKGGSLGLATAIQLRFSGTVGFPWGLNAVICKFRPRRFK